MRVAVTNVVEGRAVNPPEGLNPIVFPEIVAVGVTIGIGNVVFVAREKWIDGCPVVFWITEAPVPVGSTDVSFIP